MLKFTRRNDEIEELEEEEMVFDEVTDESEFDDGGFVKPATAPEAAPAFPSGAISLKIINPQSYEEASEIADYLMNGNTVLLNMDSIERELAVRILDYLKGAIQVVGGMMTKAGKTTIVVAPKNVDISSIEAMVGNTEQ